MIMNDENLEPLRKRLGDAKFDEIAAEMRVFAIGYMFDLMHNCWSHGISLPRQRKRGRSFLKDSRAGILDILITAEDCLTKSYGDAIRNPYVQDKRGAYFLNKDIFEMAILERFEFCFDLVKGEIVRDDVFQKSILCWKDQIYRSSLADPLVVRRSERHRAEEIARLADEDDQKSGADTWLIEGF
jgi:hypothetical protein